MSLTGNLSGIATGIVMISIVLSIGTMIVSEFAEVASNETMMNVSSPIIGEASEAILGFLPIIVIVAIVAIILGVVFTAFGRSKYLESDDEDTEESEWYCEICNKADYENEGYCDKCGREACENCFIETRNEDLCKECYEKKNKPKTKQKPQPKIEEEKLPESDLTEEDFNKSEFD